MTAEEFQATKKQRVTLRNGWTAHIVRDESEPKWKIKGTVETPDGKRFDCWNSDGHWLLCDLNNERDIVDL